MVLKVQIALSEDRAGVRAELAAAGIPNDGVAELGYADVPDATPGLARQAGDRVPPLVDGEGDSVFDARKRRISGVGRSYKPEGGIAHRSAKPDWLRVKAPTSPKYFELVANVRAKKLHTVCEEAACPNIGDCWASGHLTVMILGDTCTRGCAFCNIKTGRPNEVNPHEPASLAQMAVELGLKHMVITSVDRDDLADGGTGHWAACIAAIKAQAPQTTVEILTPDFRRKEDQLAVVVADIPVAAVQVAV